MTNYFVSFQMMKTKRSFTAVFMLALVFAVGGCNKSNQVSEAQHLENAKSYQARGKIQAQIIELKNILQTNPKHAEAQWLLGEAYAVLGYGIDAEKELLRAKELGIDAETIKIPLGKAILDQRDYKRVLSDIQSGPKSAVKSLAGIKTLHAQAQLGLREFQKGCDLFREAKQTDPTYVPAYWGVSQCAQGYSKPIEAADELDKALEIEPKNADSWLLRGDLWRSEKNMVEAEKAYTTALGLRPEHLASLLARVSVRVPQDNTTGALEDLNAADKIIKDYPLARYFRGVMFFKEKKYTEAKTAFDAVLLVNADYPPAILWAGMADYALNNLEQASHAFLKYTNLVPNSKEAKTLLALTMARLGGKKEAKETLAALEKMDISDPQSLLLIGQAHMLTGDNQAGARYLARAIEKQPDAIDPRVSLVAALLQQGDKPGALHQAEEIYKKTPNDLKAASLLIGALLENRKFDDALEVVKQIEKRMPSSHIPHVFRAAVKAEIPDVEGAKSELEKAHKIQPGNALIGHSLAAIAIQQKQFDAARRYYKEVSDKNDAPFETQLAIYDLEVVANRTDVARKLIEELSAKYQKAARPATIMATVYAANGELDKALQVSAQAAEANPSDVNLITARGGAFYLKGDLANALVHFQRIVKLRPDLPEGHFKVALVNNDKSDFTALRNNLNQVLKLDPKHIRAKIMLASLNIRDKKWEDAIKLTSSARQDNPAIAEAYVLESTALMLLKREPEAFDVLERALKAAPYSDMPAIEIARLRFRAGQTEAGFNAINTWLAAHPNSIRGNAFLAENLMAQKKLPEAAQIYEKILKLEPENAIALNNLANALASGEPSRALGFAERAFKKAPDDASVTDTLGWLLLKNGQPKRALELIEKALKAAPSAPDLQYHFAAALAQNGDKARARKELENILSKPDNFPEKQEAKALLETL